MMRSRSFAVLSALLLFTAGAAPCTDETKSAATATKSAGALWQFNTHG